jgi:endo-1,3(4)-beta-glucanase
VELIWETAFAKSYEIQVSKNGEHWKTIYYHTKGEGVIEAIHFKRVSARWLRIQCTQRGTPFGDSLWEFAVYR